MFRYTHGCNLNIFNLSRLLSTIVSILLLTGCYVGSGRLPSAPTSDAAASSAPAARLILSPSLTATQPGKQVLSNPTSPVSPLPVAPTSTPPPSIASEPPATYAPQSSQTGEFTPAASAGSQMTQPVNSTRIKTVFIIVMENKDWSDILNNPSAPFINHTLLPQASYANQYYSGIHPSEPNYIWLEAGSPLGITNDDTPEHNHQSTTDHLVTYMDKAGISWKSYLEGITGEICPLENEGLFVPKHNPMLFFDDVTDNNDPNSAYCIAHERPFEELQSDLENNTVAQYNFITPDQCNNMHDSDGCQTKDKVKNGDTWLSEHIPQIMGSEAYQQGGVIFIIWDEAKNDNDPIGMIMLSPFAKGDGYSNHIHYTHSSTLRTIQEIFGLTPLLRDAANATDLSDFFAQFP